MKKERIIIMGAAGRDFHNFNICFRDNAKVQVVAFTATQIPNITNRCYPPSLAGEFYPEGIPIYDEMELPELITGRKVDKVIFAYSDVSYSDVMHRAAIVLARGASFSFLGPNATMIKSSKPVISVSAVRTGCGKSQLTGYLCDIVRERGLIPVVVRHPMPYGDLEKQEVERFAGFDDLELYRCTIEEREEFEPLISKGTVVFAGVDYVKILARAEQDGDVIIWDGGNNDFPFFIPDIEITIVDPLRSGDETGYFPGEVNLRRASVVVINKANTVVSAVNDRLESIVRSINPRATVMRTDSEPYVSEPEKIRGRDVLVIEDGPSMTHGGLISGAGYAAAVKYGAARIIDPRPYTIGSIAEIYRQYPHIGNVLPAMGYGTVQIEDLRQTIENIPAQIVLAATPINLNRIFGISKPVIRVQYNLAEKAGSPLKKNILQFLARKSQ
jgi:predicted GTPase